MATDNFQLSPADAEARFQRLQMRRERHPDADDPLFRPIDADDFRTNGDNASDFSNLRQNGLIRITFPLPPNMRLIDPATNAASAETFVDVWRSVPTVNDVALTGPDGVNPWPRGPNVSAATSWTHASRRFRSRRSVRSPITRRFRCAAATAARRSVLVSAGAVHEPSRSRPVRRRQGGHGAVAGSRSAARRARAAGQSRVRARLQPVPRWSWTVDHTGPGRFDFTTSRASVPVPSTRRRLRALRLQHARLDSPGTPERTRSCCHRSCGLIPPGQGSPSSDPGRALLTGFVGGAPAQDDWDKFDVPGLRGIRKTAPYFHNNSAATLEEVVDHYMEFFNRVQVNTAPGARAASRETDGVHFNRRPTPDERDALLAYLRKL